MCNRDKLTPGTTSWSNKNRRLWAFKEQQQQLIVFCWEGGSDGLTYARGIPTPPSEVFRRELLGWEWSWMTVISRFQRSSAVCEPSGLRFPTQLISHSGCFPAIAEEKSALGAAPTNSYASGVRPTAALFLFLFRFSGWIKTFLSSGTAFCCGVDETSFIKNRKHERNTGRAAFSSPRPPWRPWSSNYHQSQQTDWSSRIMKAGSP